MGKEICLQTLVSAIVPAWNEATRIGNVLAILCNHPLINEVIVVDDGSTDDTFKEASRYPVKIIRLNTNEGKAHAMDIGIKAAISDVVFFCDADIVGLTEDGITKMVRPVIFGECDMYLGLCDRWTYRFNKIFHIFPLIGGERVLKKDVWYDMPDLYKKNFQIEIALNFFSKIRGRSMKFSLLSIDQVRKEKKYGFLVGMKRRWGMMYDIVAISFKLYVVYAMYLYSFTFFTSCAGQYQKYKTMLKQSLIRVATDFKDR